MEEKKTTKISLSTFFLIIAIIAIGVMGYFIYKLNDDKTKAKEEVSQVNSKIKTLESSISSLQNTYNNNNTSIKNKNEKEQNTSFNSLSGIYVGDTKTEPSTTLDGETKVKLFLYENGSYNYKNNPGLDSGSVGYYTFNDNDLILHEVISCGNDIGRTITNDTITLKINDDNSFTDSKSNAVLSKSSEKIENKTDTISNELKNALNNNSLR